KAFLVTFTQLTAAELEGTGVRFQVLLPAVIKTEFHSVQGIEIKAPRMSAEDVVTASLAALDKGEVLCSPALEDPAVLERIGEQQRAAMAEGIRPTLAARYR